MKKTQSGHSHKAEKTDQHFTSLDDLIAALCGAASERTQDRPADEVIRSVGQHLVETATAAGFSGHPGKRVFTVGAKPSAEHILEFGSFLQALPNIGESHAVGAWLTQMAKDGGATGKDRSPLYNAMEPMDLQNPSPQAVWEMGNWLLSTIPADRSGEDLNVDDELAQVDQPEPVNA